MSDSFDIGESETLRMAAVPPGQENNGGSGETAWNALQTPSAVETWTQAPASMRPELSLTPIPSQPQNNDFASAFDDDADDLFSDLPLAARKKGSKRKKWLIAISVTLLLL